MQMQGMHIVAAIAEFQAGRPLAITDADETIAALPVDGLGAATWAAFKGLCAPALPRLVKVWPYFRRPPPDKPPANFPVWPLWYAALAWVHVRQAGALLVVGLAIGALLPAV